MNRPTLVIVGPTASGKSALAFEVARRTGAEIISADSMAVYRGMDIGTAKPSTAERAIVRHHLIDVVNPDEEFSVSEFQRLATAALSSAECAVVVGGTGLYVDALVDGLTMAGQWPEVRDPLEARTTEDLWAQLNQADPQAATKIEPGNRRRIVRALEVTLGSGRPFSSFGPGLQAARESTDRRFRLVGLRLPRPLVAERIAGRYRAQMERGFLEEVRGLGDRYGDRLSRTALQALGYRELLAHLNGHLTLDEALAEAIRRTIKLAKRQERWFRRDPRIHWLDVGASNEPEGNLARLAEQALADWA